MALSDGSLFKWERSYAETGNVSFASRGIGWSSLQGDVPASSVHVTRKAEAFVSNVHFRLPEND